MNGLSGSATTLVQDACICVTVCCMCGLSESATTLVQDACICVTSGINVTSSTRHGMWWYGSSVHHNRDLSWIL